VTTTYWQAWHEPYDQPGSYLARRLAVVQSHLRAVLDSAPPGPVRVVSLCAGEGRDLLGVLADHPRRDDVVARLVEKDAGNAEVARASAAQAGLVGVDVVCGDASSTDSFVGAVPADLVLLCGIFGNIVDADIEHTVAVLREFCAPGATVVWTRHRKEPDLTPTIRQWFRERNFEEVAFEAPEDVLFSVGVERFVGEPAPLRAGRRLFEFVAVD